MSKSRGAKKNAAHAHEEREEQIATIMARARKLIEKNDRGRSAAPPKPKRKSATRP